MQAVGDSNCRCSRLLGKCRRSDRDIGRPIPVPIRHPAPAGPNSQRILAVGLMRNSVAVPVPVAVAVTVLLLRRLP